MMRLGRMAAPDAKTLIRLARLLDEPVLKEVLTRLVALGRERRVVRGRRLRVDTTARGAPVSTAEPIGDPHQGARAKW